MNDVSKKQKDSIMKSLAIAGFLGIIILIAWLSIQLVHLLPGTFSSLASLAEGINQYQQSVIETEKDPAKMAVTSDRTIVNAGGAVVLSWETTDTPGSYTFAYDCAEGVAVDILTDSGERSIACNQNYNVGSVDTLNLRVDSEKDRFTDLRYTISFLATNDTAPRAAGSALITVHNSDITDILIAGSTEVAATSTSQESTEEVAGPEVTEPETVVEAPETPAVEETPATSPTQVFEQEYIYEIPESDPNGRTDLTSRFIQTGTIVGGLFFAGSIGRDEAGAVQFEVRNLGNKTSEEWTYEITLPGGTTYTSDDQAPLKPNETATITVGFPRAIGSTHVFRIDVNTTADRNPSNNDTTYVVAFAG
tara:strand:- start:2754 stop:3845 length:1092 start_codon:yes stop_codon:yes gene_type:complete